MPNWISITAANLQDAKAKEILEALLDNLAEDQEDPTPAMIQQVVDEIRDCIRFCPRTPVDLDVTKIPKGIADVAVKKIVRQMKAFQQTPFTEEDRDDEKLYQKRLENLKNCDWPVPVPDTAEAIQTMTPKTGGAQVVRTSCDQTSRSKLRGL